MSTPSAAYDASLAPKEYFCYTCNQTVFIDASAAAAGELYCPECRAAFLEEVTLTGPTIHYFPFDLTHTASSPPRSSSSSTAAPAPPSNLSNFITSFLGLQDGRRARSRSGSGAASAAGTGTTENEPEPFDRLAFFQNYIQDLERRGANIQVLLDGNIVDGLDLEQPISANDPNRYGSPPATESAMSTLGDVVLTDAMVAAAEGAECAVCKQDFSSGDGAKQMPCKHTYHTECIIRWLGLHNSCPVCPFQLPTDEPDDDEGNKASNQQSTVGIASPLAFGSSATAEEGEGQNARVTRPFGGLGGQIPQQDGNNGGAGSSSRVVGS